MPMSDICGLSATFLIPERHGSEEFGVNKARLAGEDSSWVCSGLRGLARILNHRAGSSRLLGSRFGLPDRLDA
jgi:hypothetical protein